MKKALVVHPDVTVIGGAEKVALHIISYLLEHDWSVTLLTLFPVDFQAISKVTEFNLPPGDVHVLKAFCPSGIRKSSALSLIRLAFLHRTAQKISHDFDLCISTYNELNFGKPGIQYIHHPYWPERRLLHKNHTIWNRNVLDNHPLYEKMYRFVAHSIANNFSGFGQNRTLVNSKFIQGVVKSVYNIDSTVLYPGFLSDADFKKPDNLRRFQLVVISRLTPDKNILELIHSFFRLSQKEPDARLFIAGYPGDPAYLESIRSLISRYGVPVELKTNITREEVTKLLQESQFYISTKKYEHFGISVLEAVTQGCIPLVHHSGGATEIVPFAGLHFDLFEELPDKIIGLRNNPRDLEKIQSSLFLHIQKFHKKYFYKGLEQVISNQNF